MFNIQKCAVIGCGYVGATTAFSLMQSGLFSEMVLLDINQKRAEGEAMDLTHGLPFLSPMQIYAGDYSDLHDALCHHHSGRKPKSRAKPGPPLSTAMRKFSVPSSARSSATPGMLFCWSSAIPWMC